MWRHASTSGLVTTDTIAIHGRDRKGFRGCEPEILTIIVRTVNGHGTHCHRILYQASNPNAVHQCSHCAYQTVCDERVVRGVLSNVKVPHPTCDIPVDGMRVPAAPLQEQLTEEPTKYT